MLTWLSRRSNLQGYLFQGYLFSQLPPQADPNLSNSWHGIGQIHTFEVQCPDWCQLNLALEQDYLVAGDRQAVQIVRFASNFHHNLTQFRPSQRNRQAERVLQAWELHLKTIQQILQALFCIVKTSDLVESTPDR